MAVGRAGLEPDNQKLSRAELTCRGRGTAYTEATQSGLQEFVGREHSGISFFYTKQHCCPNPGISPGDCSSVQRAENLFAGTEQV